MQKWSHFPVMFKQVKTALVKVRISKGAEKTQGTVVKKTRSHLADCRLGKVSHVSRGRWIFGCCSHFPWEMDQKHVILPFFRRLLPSTIAMKSCVQLPHWKFHLPRTNCLCKSTDFLAFIGGPGFWISLYAKRRHLTLLVATFRNIVISNTLFVDCTWPCMVRFSYTQLQTNFCPMSVQAWSRDVSWWPWLSFRPSSGGHSGLLHPRGQFVWEDIMEQPSPNALAKGFRDADLSFLFDQWESEIYNWRASLLQRCPGLWMFFLPQLQE